MLKTLKDDKNDFVFASRYEKNCGSEDDALITLTGNYIFTFLGKIFFKLDPFPEIKTQVFIFAMKFYYKN